MFCLLFFEIVFEPTDGKLQRVSGSSLHNTVDQRLDKAVDFTRDILLDLNFLLFTHFIIEQQNKKQAHKVFFHYGTQVNMKERMWMDNDGGSGRVSSIISKFQYVVFVRGISSDSEVLLTAFHYLHDASVYYFAVLEKIIVVVGSQTQRTQLSDSALFVGSQLRQLQIFDQLLSACFVFLQHMMRGRQKYGALTVPIFSQLGTNYLQEDQQVGLLLEVLEVLVEVVGRGNIYLCGDRRGFVSVFVWLVDFWEAGFSFLRFWFGDNFCVEFFIVDRPGANFLFLMHRHNNKIKNIIISSNRPSRTLPTKEIDLYEERWKMGDGRWEMER